MSEAAATQTLVDRILGGSAPVQVRAAAARGALPLPRADLVRVQIHLLQDSDPEISAEAGRQLEGLDEPALIDLFSDGDCAPEVLSHFSGRAVRSEKLAELLVFHDAVPDEALNLMAERGSAQVIDLVLTNQQRVLASPGLLDKLSANPAVRADQRGRILDMLDRFVSRMTEQAAAPTDDPTAESAEREFDFEDAARILDVDVGELFTASEIMGGEEFETAESEEIRSVYRKILTLNTAQKAILAMRGGREERMILVRDSSKIVALSVLRNPRVNDQEIEGMAKMRNVSDEVLRSIGSNREWVKNLAVVKALVHNPKTPPGISTNFVSRLNDHELKFLVRDKNVPEIIRRMARKNIQIREERKRPKFLKKK